MTTYTPTVERFPVFHGLSKGEEITLIDGVPLGGTGGAFGFEAQRIVANRGYRGIHLASPDTPAFNTATVELEYLREWSRLKRPNTAGADIDPGRSARDRVAKHGPFTITLISSEGQSIRHHQRLSTRTTETVAGAQLVISRDDVANATEFDTVLKQLMDLLTLAAHAPAGAVSRTLLAPRAGMPDSDKVTVQGSGLVEVLGPQNHVVKPATANETRIQYLFTVVDINFADLIPRWLDLHEQLWLPVSMLAGLFYEPRGYDELRLLVAAVAAEGIHRELHLSKRPYSDEDFAELRKKLMDAVPRGAPNYRRDRTFVSSRIQNELTYLERLRDLAAIPDATAVKTLIADVDGWAKFLKEFRNAVAHASRDRVTVNEAVMIHDAGVVTVGLLVLVLMQQLGVASEVQRRAAAGQRFIIAAQRFNKDPCSGWSIAPVEKGESTRSEAEPLARVSTLTWWACVAHPSPRRLHRSAVSHHGEVSAVAVGCGQHLEAPQAEHVSTGLWEPTCSTDPRVAGGRQSW